MLSNEYLTQCSSSDLIDIVREYESAFTTATARIADLERQLTQRTGRVTSEHRSITAILQPVQVKDEDYRLWA